MGASNIAEMVERDARACVCGKRPAWEKLRGGGVILACMNTKCKRYPARKGRCASDAIQNWNQEVSNYDTVREGH